MSLVPTGDKKVGSETAKYLSGRKVKLSSLTARKVDRLSPLATAGLDK